MKILLIAGILALAYIANAKEVDLNNEDKQKLMNSVITELEKEAGKQCMDALKPNLLNTASKYMTKVINGKPFFKQDGKERSLKDFITNSEIYKTSTSAKCKKSFLKSVGKAAKKGVKFIGKSLWAIITSR